MGNKVLPPAAGMGRVKGVPNKATKNAREAIAMLVDGNTHRLEAWLDEIAAKDPVLAWRCMMDVIEFHIPKLQRTEHAGDPNSPIQTSLTVTFK